MKTVIVAFMLLFNYLDTLPKLNLNSMALSRIRNALAACAAFQLHDFVMKIYVFLVAMK